MSESARPFVEMSGVNKSFGDKPVLHDFSWSVPAGQVCGLLGPNGAGKTTLFRLLMGILKRTSGSLLIDGRDAFEERVVLKRVVGYLPDEPVFYSYLSGREILELSAGMHDLDVATAVSRVMPLVQRLKLDDAIDRYADDYSRGMKKKLGLVLSLLHEPKLLILDEPTNGLDVEATRLFFDIMRELSAAGTTILFSTHLMDHVERLCSHAAILHAGRLAAAGSLDELRTRFARGRSLEDAFIEIVDGGGGTPA
jgi:ABC-type multidrug transport system ATPase subunit